MLVAFILFCIAASAVYVLNDPLIFEVIKASGKIKKRPLASGELIKRQGLFILFALYALILPQAWLFPDVFQVLLIYLVLNVLILLY